MTGSTVDISTRRGISVYQIYCINITLQRYIKELKVISRVQMWIVI